MDRLDKFSVCAMIILLISSLALISNHRGEAKSDQNNREKVSPNNPIVNSVLGHKVKEIKDLIEAGNLNKAEMFTNLLIKKYPYEGDPRILMGDIFMRKQEPIMAALEYKEAVDLNPDYLDKKTPIFQGKKIEVAVKDAIAEIERKIDKNPEDESMKRYRKNVYYLQRRIAGGCS